MITKEVSDKLGYYVYALVDPRNKQIFYIGKGKGNRVFEHAQGIKSNEEDEDDSEKIALIKEILSAKQEVKYYILRHELENEEVAYLVESTLIDILTYTPFKGQELGHLANIQCGHHQGDNGIKTIEEIMEFYGAEEFDLAQYVEKGINFIAIKLNYDSFSLGDEAQLFKQTSFCWRVSKDRANKCHYALAVVNGIVRGVYPCFNAWRATKPEEVSDKYPQDAFRYCFDRVDALDETQFQQIKADLVGKRIKGLHKGQNAIAYFDSLNKKQK